MNVLWSSTDSGIECLWKKGTFEKQGLLGNFFVLRHASS